MKTYRVEFCGTAYVKADSKKDAEATILDDLDCIDYEDAEVNAFEWDEEE